MARLRGSLHAVNGGQLHGVSSSVATALGGGAAVNSNGTVSAPTYTVGGTTVNNVGSAISGLDGRVTSVDNRVTTVDGRVTNVEGSVTNLTNSINNGTTGLVRQDATTKVITVASDKAGTQVDLTGTAGARQLRGVANGTVAADSLHAVNGGQLHGVSSSVATALGGGSAVNNDGSISAPTYTVGGTTVNNVGGAITNLDGRVTTVDNRVTNIDGRVTNVEGSVTNLTSNINNGAVGLVKQDATTKAITVASDKAGTQVDLTGTAGARQLRGVANGTVAAGSLHAVNGGQLHGVSSSVATALGGGATVNSNGTVSAPTYTVGGTTVNNVGSAITNLDGRVTTIDGRVTNVEGDITDLANTINNGMAGLVKQDATTKEITVAKDKDGLLMDLTGTAGARQLRGVANGTVAAGSLFAVNGGQLHGVSSSIATALGGGSAVNNDGSISGPTYTVGGTTVNNVGGAITNLDNRVTNVEGSITQITNNINSGTIGLVKQDAATGDINVATDKGGKVVNVAGTEGARQLTGVADGLIGAGSTDAVNGSQIFSLTQQLAKGGGASHYFQADGKSDGSDAAIVRSESRGVAIGSYGEASGNAAVAVGADAKASADNSVALGAGSVADRADTVSVGNADAERQIVNVAAGTQDTDAVNLGQMRSYASQGNSQTLNQANAYTNRQVGAVRRDANAGTASAMAMAGLPQAVKPGKGMAALGASAYSGESAVALGVSKMSSSGKWVYKAIVSSNTRGNYGSTVSAGFHW
ncbi:YadA family autotransporter adhesin [Cupriavidus campinensis]|uniref:YadA family autotransporter adhesin n=1 Tax=Cupriavidus campinensis TaxID=151783 RepID=UPI0011F001BA|nr:YadA-like family protein [Cupriavidus campinensis]